MASASSIILPQKLVAKVLLSKGDLVQRSEKLWGGVALAVKRIAAKRGTKLEQHGSLWLFVK